MEELITASRLASILIYSLLMIRVIFLWNEPRTADWAKRATPWWIAMLLLWSTCVVFFFSPEHIMRANHMDVSDELRLWMQVGGIALVNLSGICALIALAVSRGGTGLELVSIAVIPASLFVVSLIL